MNRRKLYILYILFCTISIGTKKEAKSKKGGNYKCSKSGEPFKREKGFVKVNHFIIHCLSLSPDWAKD